MQRQRKYGSEVRRKPLVGQWHCIDARVGKPPKKRMKMRLFLTMKEPAPVSDRAGGSTPDTCAKIVKLLFFETLAGCGQ
jgi:hypothetical protein